MDKMDNLLNLILESRPNNYQHCVNQSIIKYIKSLHYQIDNLSQKLLSIELETKELGNEK